MEFAFVILHKDCDRLAGLMTAKTLPKFAYEDATNEGNTLHLRCTLCQRLIHLTMTEIVEDPVG